MYIIFAKATRRTFTLPSSTPAPLRRTTAATRALRWSSMLRQLDPQLPSVHRGSIEGLDGIICISLVVETNKGKAATFLRESVTRDINVADIPVSFEHSL